MFDSDRARFSARIERAAAEIESVRQAVVEGASSWDKQIDRTQEYLRYGPMGRAEGPWLGDWMTELLSHGEPVTENAAVTRVTASNTRLSRLALAAGPAANDADAKITVISENEVAITLQSGTKEQPVPIVGVDVMVRDALKEDSEFAAYPTGETGTAVIPVNAFTLDEFNILHLCVQADSTALGYHDFAIEDMDLVMSWYEDTNTFRDVEQHWGQATTHEGNVYTFKGPWKQKFSPSIYGDVALSVGATIFWVKLSKSWDIVHGELYSSNGAGGLLEHYMYPNDDPDPVDAVSDEPHNYPALASEATRITAVASGLYAREVDATSTDMLVNVHDIEIKHRVYRDPGGERMLDIAVKNHAATREALKLTCAVYVDGSREAEYLNLPMISDATSSRRTQTITLPVSALVDDPAAHGKARVEITAVGRNERAYATNEFQIMLGGQDALRFTREPQDVTAQEGEDVSFSAEVEGGVKPYACQWQVYNPKTGKWDDLKGCTELTITRQGVEKKWDGAKLRCVVTDAVGTSITSREATLNVRDSLPTGDHSRLAVYLAIALAAIVLLALVSRKGKRAKG